MSAVVITGSTKGIGLGLAREFAARGHNVLVSGRRQESVDEALTALGSSAGQVRGQPCDVSDRAQLQALWDRAAADFGGVSIWINNAGVAHTTQSIEALDDASIHAMLETNYLGTLQGSRVALAGMRAQGAGKLFNMLGGGSDGEYFPGMGVYGSTKRALDYLTQALVKETAGSGIIVGRIRPGMIITEGVIREAKADLDNFNRSRNTMNALCDTVETVAPFLVEQMLATERSGRKIRWLSGGKIAGRMMRARFGTVPDKFAPFGL